MLMQVSKYLEQYEYHTAGKFGGKKFGIATYIFGGLICQTKPSKNKKGNRNRNTCN